MCDRVGGVEARRGTERHECALARTLESFRASSPALGRRSLAIGDARRVGALGAGDSV